MGQLAKLQSVKASWGCGMRADEHSSFSGTSPHGDLRAHCFPEAFVKERTSQTEQDPVGLLSTDAFLCPPFPVYREHTPGSVTFPEFQKAGSNGY